MKLSYCFFFKVGCPCVWGTVLRIKMSSWWTSFLMNMYCPSLYFFIHITLKTILLDIKTATAACFVSPFCGKILFQHFTQNKCLFLMLMCVFLLCIRWIDLVFISILLICVLFVEELRPRILRVINE